MRAKAFVFWVTALFFGFNGVAQAGPALGQPAPALVVTTLGGAEFNLEAHKGKVVVLHYWATWCPACKTEMPWLSQLYNRLHARGVEVLGLSQDRPRDRDQVAKYMKDFPFQAAILREAKKNDFGSPNTLPVTYIIDSQGVVRAEFEQSGTPLDEKVLTSSVTALLPK